MTIKNDFLLAQHFCFTKRSHIPLQKNTTSTITQAWGRIPNLVQNLVGRGAPGGPQPIVDGSLSGRDSAAQRGQGGRRPQTSTRVSNVDALIFVIVRAAVCCLCLNIKAPSPAPELLRSGSRAVVKNLKRLRQGQDRRVLWKRARVAPGDLARGDDGFKSNAVDAHAHRANVGVHPRSLHADGVRVHGKVLVRGRKAAIPVMQLALRARVLGLVNLPVVAAQENARLVRSVGRKVWSRTLERGEEG